VLLSLALWTLWIEPSMLVTHRVQLSLKGAPPELGVLRVVVLTDLHVGSPFNGLSNLQRVVRLANSLQPDLVLLPGDFVIRTVLGGHVVDAEPIAAELHNLRAPLGVFAVLGNHDWWYDGPRVNAALRGAGIAVLEDTAVALRAKAPLWLAGVSDMWEAPHDIARAVRAVPPGVTLLLFTHNPDLFPIVPRNVSLTIAGHTHGGQVNLPFLGRLVVPSSFGQRYAAGHVVEGGRQMYVGTGIGTSILPVRFRVRPEVLLLLLRPSVP
jgi:predicted MPP superfamily phosphohydrolase